MSANNELKLKKVSSSDSLFSNSSEYDNDNFYDVLKTCKTIKKGDEMIPLIVDLKNTLEEKKIRKEEVLSTKTQYKYICQCALHA